MLRNYLKIALKVLLRRKFFTFISLFAISFTLVVLMVATAILDQLFVPRPPETRADRTLAVMGMSIRGPNISRTSNAGYGFLNRYVRGIPGSELVSVSSMPNMMSTFVDGAKVKFFLKRTDGEFWRIMQFRFLEGGPYSSEDDAQASRVAVINESTRGRFFAGAPALGRDVEFDGERFRVVGVVEDVANTSLHAFADIWVPTSTSRSDAYKSEFIGQFMGLILLKDKSLIPATKAEFQSRLASAVLPDPKTYTTLTGGADTTFDSVSRLVFNNYGPESHAGALWAVMLGGMVLFMTLPAINLVNINLSRILERSSEIGVRKAFGATSRTLVGQFVVENVILCLIGGALGWILSAAALTLLNRSGLIPHARFDLNLRILACGVVTAVFFGLLSGVYPAWRMSRLHPVEALRGRSE